MALLFAGRAALYLGDDEAAFRTHNEAAARARASGALSIVAQILFRLATAELWAGRWPSAAANAREGLQLAREIGQHDSAAQQLVVLAVIAGLRGSEDECRSLAAESRELASARGLGIVAEVANWALTALELGLGRPEEALRRAREISATMVVFWAGLDRIEAAIRAGERDTAHAWLDVFESVGGEQRNRLVTSGGPALPRTPLGGGRSRTTSSWPRSTRTPRPPVPTSMPERASPTASSCAAPDAESRRVSTCARRSTASRASEHRSGPRGRASSCGRAARQRESVTRARRAELTEQELQIARFVSEGLTNREVAAQLFLSPRTIDFHLRNVYRKLGISSRTALARLDLDSENVSAQRTAV